MNKIIFETDVQSDRILHLPDEIPIGAHIRIMIQTLSSVSTSRHSRRPARHRDFQTVAFPVTEFELPTKRSVYQGPPLTLQQMRDAIDWEAGQRQ
ncbi:hypothetical protein Thiowin_00088 [Thiorhodovibrio winogradskyi]|uniref:Uncharacterized protein n=1 Tax=Thiorhodovibrio winogradskyi TaxID=77007 RepID=A0ABZ0S4C2_9GAMM|nr:hypothetical protein [Thiorhodovibrio winogradskyi]